MLFSKKQHSNGEQHKNRRDQAPIKFHISTLKKAIGVFIDFINIPLSYFWLLVSRCIISHAFKGMGQFPFGYLFLLCSQGRRSVETIIFYALGSDMVIKPFLPPTKYQAEQF